MKRRDFLAATTVGVVRGWAAETRTNVLLMIADDMNTALGCYGNPLVETPNLNRFASRSVLFERAYCQFPLCAPSRASFLSGRRPETTRVLSLTVPTRKYMRDVIMLPELFRKNGYYTANCGKIYHTGPEHDDPRSWDFVLPGSGKGPPASEVIESHEARDPRNHSMDWAKLRTPDVETPGGIVAQTAIEQIGKAVGKKQPFFVGVGFRRPHSPYSVPKKYFDLYDTAKILLPATGDTKRLPAAAWYELANQPALSEKEQREYIAAYYASVSFMDAQAGLVLHALDRMKLWDRTTVVFFGDHGYHTGEHGMWHKMTLFEESTRVPLMIHAPGIGGAGKRCRGLVELLDLYPTLAETCEIKPPAGLEGMSLAPLLADPAKRGKPAVYSVVGRNDDRTLSHKEPTYFGHAVRTERWRYIEWDGSRRGHELYDHKNDPQELRNVADEVEYHSTVTEMKKFLRARTAEAY
jgi:iduronate 2-sulfatase